MSYPGKILFISVPIGSGHIRAAQAVGSAVARLAPELGVVYANLFDFFQPGIGSFIFKTYLKILEYFPQLYGRMYKWGNKSPGALAGQRLISKYLAGRMLNYIHAVSPSAIVCTHATPAGLIAHLNKTARLEAITAAVVTDFAVHRLWVYPEINYYFLADKSLQDVISPYGIGSDRSFAMGIPIDEKFNVEFDKKTIGKKLGLNGEKKTILIMGGGAGLLPMTDIIKVCDAIGIPLQVIAVAGKNIMLFEQLKEIRSTLVNCELYPFGFSDKIPELMAAADLIITKPGGLTSSEALSRHLPMVIFRPIPGQEEANTKYLVDNEVAFSVKSLIDLRKAVSKLLYDDKLLATMRVRAGLLAKPSAAADIAREIIVRMKR